MYKKILHGYRQFMLKDVWSIPLMNETLFLLLKEEAEAEASIIFLWF